MTTRHTGDQDTGDHDTGDQDTGDQDTGDQDTGDLLEAMVRIDSANPGLAEHGPGESELAAFVAGWAEAAGLRVQVLEPVSGRPSVLVRGGRGQSGRRLLLCGHLDTVGHTVMNRPLVPRVEGDRLYGRGAYDMKAGVATALVACRDAAAAGLA